jgi:acyl-CoA dehydrogenase
MGGDYRHEVVLMEQLGRHGADHWGVSLHNAIVAPLHHPLRHRGAEAALAAPLATGELIGAIAMTEPGAARTCRASRPRPHGRQPSWW